MKFGLKLRSKKGQGLVEYALIIALIAVVCIVALRTLGNSASDRLDEVATEVGNSGTPA